MRRFLPAFCCTVIVLTSLLITQAATHHGPINQAPQIQIQNIRPVEVSSGELRVTATPLLLPWLFGRVNFNGSGKRLS